MSQVIASPLHGRVALVTGASRGIGRAIAVALARAGADVAINYHTREDDAAGTREAVAAAGRRAAVVRADVSKTADIRTLVDTVVAELGPVSILVNNAAVGKPQPIASLTEEDWDRLMDTNLKSAFLLSQAVLPAMRERKWGRIINISSVAAQLGGVIGPHYAASKAGMHGLTHAYAKMLATEGITANTIAPALIATEMVTSNPNAKADLIPVGRFGDVDEVAEIAVMLAKNAYITGQTINVNGGWYMS
jgi:3-oxoacyl-[acyl-carrier protein] reductase